MIQLSKAQIISMKQEIPTEDSLCWIYFLIKDNRIVYVGQTARGISRILSHFIQKDKVFDSYTYIVVDLDDLNEVEQYYIDKFKPLYNFSRKSYPHHTRIST